MDYVLKLIGFKGRFPVDIGGKILYGDAPFQADEAQAQKLLMLNPGILFETDETGKPLGAIPEPVAVEVEVKAPTFKPEDPLDVVRGITHTEADEKKGKKTKKGS